MPTRLLALALLTPTLALAQEQPAPPGAMPVYPAVPVAQPPPAATPPPSRGPTRDSWYIGFGIGTGSGNLTWEDGRQFSFTDVNLGRDTTNVAVNFKVGSTLAPTLLLGFDLTAVGSRGSDAFGTSSIRVANYDAMLTWFPWETGFLLRGGLGLSSMSLTTDFVGAPGTRTYTGANVAAGVGYAFWLARSFNLTLDLDLSAQGYGTGNGPKSSGMWNLWVGFDWY